MSLDVIKAQPDKTGVVKLCRSTLDTPLELTQNVTLTADEYQSVTIGCEGRKSTSKKSPACGITRLSAAGFFEIGVDSVGPGSEVSFQFENIAVMDTDVTDTSFIAYFISGNNTLSILNSNFTSVQGTVQLIDGQLDGGTNLDIQRSDFDGADVRAQRLAVVAGSSGGSISIDRSTFINNDNLAQQGAVNIATVQSSMITITKSSFSNNRSPNGGGAVRIEEIFTGEILNHTLCLKVSS